VTPSVVVIGLGPGDGDLLTRATLDLIAAEARVYLRTARHPAASVVQAGVAEVISFDDVYERCPTFEEVYATIVDALVAAAVEHGRIVYAVPGSPMVAEHTVELTAFLMDLHKQGRLQTDFQKLDLSLGHHVPCHVKALGSVAGPDLLALLPGVRVQAIDVSCSGMAGTFGFRATNVETSLAAGRPMLAELAQPHIRFGSTECSTCRIQMEDATGKRTLHPVQYLALAYGLLPQVANKLQEPRRELVL
jgi:hypothetical protein